ncbi:MAG: 4-hydroxy-tetrahydrodipicolinate reductase [Deltaproteobacteria bacterium]|nr:4-hydroxy-tetrahydrodipicolinate reductase [Deltaproteobacteria bacterium]MBW1925274.1 4-hydroxy-tetrahydrodipicolinate reductase [Deltaproteobacteria bacterium]MBW1950797.1 4-hydroxy-tetrahydrodipicolinate reductase [Deltaproteobacteria bacterium]MBW2008979.1 4-hydroxy-tetrahydrodipicolinate reductase [Deltaproteobacteria bacterium]MBW2102856.1 4-hydroxy-tetrahydrodipicolinate reductase [Deltaproteobacteria bacterium]
MTDVIVAGVAGRMGMRIVHMIQQDPGVRLVGAFERPDHPAVGEDAGVVAGTGPLGIRIMGSVEEALGEGRVLIDFTAPEATLENLRSICPRGLAAVIGTTGLEGALLEEAERLAGTIRCVMAPNMSVGVNVLFKLAGLVASILGSDYDMEILEVHHRLKKDAPSGTAMRLGRILAESVGRDLEKVGVYERKGIIGRRTDEEIGIQTWRGGDITGEHTVLFAGIGERLELIHRAHNRDNFARGAIRAAKWVVDQPEGLYDMQDVLGLR